MELQEKRSLLSMFSSAPTPPPAKCVCLKHRVFERDGGSEKITLVEMEEEDDDDEGKRMWKTPKERAKKYKRINAPSPWYTSTTCACLMMPHVSGFKRFPKSFSSSHLQSWPFSQSRDRRLNTETPKVKVGAPPQRRRKKRK